MSQKSQQTVFESEETYRIVAETASDAIIEIDENGAIQFINRAGERIFGYSVEEMRGQSLAMLIPEYRRAENGGNTFTRNDDAKAEIVTAERFTSEGSQFSGRHADGRRFPLEISFGEYNQNGKRFFIAIARDISKRKASERALRESEENLRLATGAARMYSWALDLQTQKSSFSDNFSEVVGLKSHLTELTLDEIFQTLIHPDDAEKTSRYIEKAIKGTGNHSTELRFVNPDTDEIVWLDVTSYNIRDKDGKPARLVGVAQNITERKLAEEKIRQSEANFRQLAEAVPQFVWVTKTDGSLGYINEQWIDFSGLSLEETNSAETLREVFHPDDRDAMFEAWANAIAAAATFEYEARIKNRQGDYQWFLIRSKPVKDKAGAVVKWFGTSTDISATKQSAVALRESEERFRAMADNISQLAWMADAGGWIFWYNRRWFDFTGTTLEQMRGWGWQAVHHPDYVEPVTERFKQSVAAGTEWEDTFPLRSKTGEYCWFLSRAQPIRDAQGNITRWFGTNTDVTESKQIELERERILHRETAAREQAEAANRAKDEFLSVLSHELRTPLNAMFGWTRMLKTGMLDEERAAQAIEVIERNVRLQNNLIEDLLDVSRIISGKMRIEKVALDFVSLVKKAIETARPVAENKNVRLEFDTAEATQNIGGDASRLQQIVNNLINNAVKFTPEGGTVSLRLSQKNGSARLEVKDTGIGIDRARLPHIFDRFYQADSTTKRAHSGLGLGLTIVRHLTELHGGSVGATSEGAGRGSTFTIEIPLLKKPENSFSEKVSNGESVVGNMLEGKRILIVDDDQDGLMPLKIVLENNLAKVESAGTAREALEKLAVADFDLLVSDIGMPAADGYDLIAKVREIEGGGKQFLPAIALTAYAAPEDRRRALDAGFQTHLAKPVDFDKFLTAVKNLLDVEAENK